MKIAYILDDDISSSTGIVKKIKSKINIWEEAGHEVNVFSLRSYTNNAIVPNGTIISTFNDNNNIIEKFTHQYKNIKVLDKYLTEFNPDLIYTRYMKYYPNMVKVLNKHAKYIIELNSNDIEEHKYRTKLIYLYNLLTRNYFLSNATAFVSVSHEIINNINFSKFQKPSITIGNGYDFSSVSANNKKQINKQLEFIFIGTPNQTWHGVEKVLFLAEHFPSYKFNIVGPSRKDILKYTDMISSNVIAHGYMSNKDIEKIISKCDVGISTLALHRNNMDEASPLKSRQYLAYGLPIIVGYKDTDIPQDSNYILNIGNYENNVNDNLEKINEFVKSVSSISPQYIHEESKKYLDQKNKEKRRLDFFKSILST